MGCLIEIEKKSETEKIIPYKRSLFLKLPEINIKLWLKVGKPT